MVSDGHNVDCIVARSLVPVNDTDLIIIAERIAIVFYQSIRGVFENIRLP
jgi:hypothetical protein